LSPELEELADRRVNGLADLGQSCRLERPHWIRAAAALDVRAVSKVGRSDADSSGNHDVSAIREDLEMGSIPPG
jgi:hypothetical protein